MSEVPSEERFKDVPFAIDEDLCSGLLFGVVEEDDDLELVAFVEADLGLDFAFGFLSDVEAFFFAPVDDDDVSSSGGAFFGSGNRRL